MNISQKNAWTLGAVLVALAVLTATWFLAVAPQRAAASALASQRVDVVAQNDRIQQQTEVLKAQFATLDEKKGELAGIRAQFPAEAEVPSLLRSLEGYATSSGVTLRTVAPGTAAPYSATGDAATTAVGAEAVAGAQSLSAMPLSITVGGTFAQTELFVKQVQADMKRYFLVSDVNLATETSTAGASSSLITTTISGNVFILPASSTATAGAMTASSSTTIPGTSSDVTTTN